MNKIDYKIKTALSEKIEIPISYKDMIIETLNNATGEKIIMKDKIKKIIIGLIATILSMSGICFAGVKVYNECIKQQASLDSRGLFDTGNGITEYETDLTQNDMKWCEESNIFYKIITNIEDYQKYKSRVQELPNMEKKDFETTFLIVLTANPILTEPHQKDIVISDIKVNNTTMDIIMEQKEKPNYNTEENIWYAIVDNLQLRENVNIYIENKKFSNKNLANVKDLPSDYSIKDAIKDGCFTLQNNKIVSSNKNQIDEFIEKTEKGKNEFLRIYSNYDNKITIEDINFEDGIYYISSYDLSNKKEILVYYNSYKKLTKDPIDNKSIFYGGSNNKDNDKTIESSPLAIVKDSTLWNKSFSHLLKNLNK